MKEIKFRGWDKERNKMVYDFADYLVSADCGSLVVGYGGAISDYYELELMQFTGLLDKNKKEIYESYIVRMYDRLHPEEIFGWGVVIFNAGCFMIEWKDDPEANMELLGIDKFGRLNKLEIIGNIYENQNTPTQ